MPNSAHQVHKQELEALPSTQNEGNHYVRLIEYVFVRVAQMQSTVSRHLDCLRKPQRVRGVQSLDIGGY